MQVILRWLFIAFQLLCVAALIFVVSGIVAMIIASTSGECPVLNEGNIRCNSPGYQSMAEHGMMVLLLTVFTGFPGLLAMAGIFFIIRAIIKWRRGPAPATPATAGGAGLPDEAAGTTEDSPAKKTWMFILKIFLIIIGLTMVAGFITGIVESLSG